MFGECITVEDSKGLWIKAKNNLYSCVIDNRGFFNRFDIEDGKYRKEKGKDDEGVTFHFIPGELW